MRRDGDGVDLAGARRENGHLARLAGHQAQLVHRSARKGRDVQMAAVDAETVVAVGGRRPAVPGARCHGLESFAGLLCRAQVAAGMLTARAREFRRQFEVVVGGQCRALPMQRQRQNLPAPDRLLPVSVVVEQLGARDGEPDSVGLAASRGKRQSATELDANVFKVRHPQPVGFENVQLHVVSDAVIRGRDRKADQAGHRRRPAIPERAWSALTLVPAEVIQETLRERRLAGVRRRQEQVEVKASRITGQLRGRREIVVAWG